MANGDTDFFGGIVFDTLIRASNVQINKVANVSQAGPGDPVRYPTTVTNPQRSPDDPLGPTAAATNLRIADPLPSGIEFAGFVGTPPCTHNGAERSITCDVGTLPADGTFTYSFNATVHSSAQGADLHHASGRRNPVQSRARRRACPPSRQTGPR